MRGHPVKLLLRVGIALILVGLVVYAAPRSGAGAACAPGTCEEQQD